ncbi:MAG TPA: hypothetical protein VMH78_07355 [Thermoplasmata archaeon]|nr:hypothetical protein [Thermoplasmata archaeon]
MLLFADHRAFPTGEDRFQKCAFCGRELVVLPDDRRGGACFDCLRLVGDEGRPCPACGSTLAGPAGSTSCPDCGWER